MAIIRMDDVSFAYDENSSVLEGIDLTLEERTISVLMGPSGAGKTTLLRLINLLEIPTAGRIKRNLNIEHSKNIKQELLLRRKMGYVFQEPALFDCTVWGNVAYGCIARQGFTKYLLKRIEQRVPFLDGDYVSIDKKVRQALANVKLAGFEHRPAKALSAGEQRRVSLARSLITDPQLLLLDEPTNNLDPYNTSIIEEIIREVQERGTTILVATHDMNQAQRIGTKVYLLLNGSIVEGGPIEKIFNCPEDERTKKFINGELIC